jgi:hypothetical protein
MILDERRIGWRNIVFDYFGDDIWKRKWDLGDQLEDLLLDKQLLCHSGHVSSQCMTPIWNFAGVTRDIIEAHVIIAYKAYICFTRANKLFLKHCLAPSAGGQIQ